MAPLLEGRFGTPAQAPAIPVVAGTTPRPFWSVMIPTCNPRRDHLEQALDSVLRQAPAAEQMQIEIVDDRSSDFDPQAFVRTLRTPRVGVYRRETPGGIGANWNTCLRRARGRWVHLLHQDDMVRFGFYDELRRAIETAPRIGAAFSQVVFVDELGQSLRPNGRVQTVPGLLQDWIEHIFVELKIQTPGMVVRRDVYESLGGFDETLSFALDWNMWKRIAVAYPIWHEPRELACYRQHRKSATARLQRSGDNISEIRRSIEFGETLLPRDVGLAVLLRARGHYAAYALGTSLQLLRRERAVRSALRQMREAVRILSGREVARLLWSRTRMALDPDLRRN